VDHEITLVVNGERHHLQVQTRRLLVHALREDLSLTGTHIGCDTSNCGACTVLINGDAALACSVLAVQVDGATITTVEGLARNGDLHPIQRAFHTQHALQCGFCTPGMMMAAVDLIEKADGVPSEDEVRKGLDGNLCRCTGYQAIVAAVRDAASEMAAV
jgi:carbon-monoxide dehydrogenase small subunit